MPEEKVHEFFVDMTCEGCSGAVQRVLAKQGDKIANVDIQLNDKKVFITSEISSEELTDVLKKTGKEVRHIESK